MTGIDEIHTDIIYDGHKLVPFCGISEEFANHPVTFINPAEALNVAGFHTAAWLTHDKEIYRRMMNQRTYKENVGRNMFGNVTLIVCYNHGDGYADQCVAYLNETKNQVITYINEHTPKIQAINLEATFIIWMDCCGSGLKTQGEPKNSMLKDARVLLNDGTTFGEKGGTELMRFNFAAPRTVVMEGLKGIKEATNRL